MSDNPESSELLNLDLNVRTDAAQQQFDAFIAHINQKQAEGFEAVAKGDQAAHLFVSDLDALRTAAIQGGEGIADFRKEVDYVIESFEKLNTVQSANSGLPPGEKYLGYGNEGGLIGPAEPEGGGGSAYALGLGARAIGQITGQQDAGNFATDLLYINQAFDQMGGVLEGLNATVTASPSLLAPLVGGFEALGVPMAGLAAVAVPVVAALVGVGLALAEVMRIAEAGAKAIDSALKTQQEYYAAIASGTTEEVRQKIAKAYDDKKAADLTLRDAEGALKNAIQASGLPSATVADMQKSALGGGLNPVQVATLPIKDLPTIFKLIEDVNRLKLEATEASESFTKLSLATKDGSLSANDAAEAARNQAGEQAEQTARIVALDKLSSDAGKERAKVLQGNIEDERKAIVGIQATNAALDPLGEQYLKNKQAIEEHSKALWQYSDDLDHLIDISIPAALAREAEIEAMKRAIEALKDIRKELDDYHKALADSQTRLANQIESATLKKEQQEQQYLAGSLQDTYERTRIATEEDRKELVAKQDTANKLDDVMAKMDDDINKAYRDLARKQTEDVIDAAQDIGRINREAGYKLREDAIDHAAKLENIKKKQDDGESDALYDRNFRELAKLQSHKNMAIQEENQAFEERKAQENRHTQDLLAERTIRLNEEMAAERRANALKIQEIQIAERNQETQIVINEQRKLETLRTAEAQQIQDLITNQIFKRQVLQQGFTNELAMYTLQEQQRMAVIAAQFSVINAISNAAQSFFNSPLGKLIGGAGNVASTMLGMPKFFDQGGSFGAGEPFVMSENRPEMLDIAGSGFNVAGAALVYPLQSGSVTNSEQSKSSGNTFSFPITIYGATDPEQTAQLVDDKIATHMEMIFGV